MLEVEHEPNHEKICLFLEARTRKMQKPMKLLDVIFARCSCHTQGIGIGYATIQSAIRIHERLGTRITRIGTGHFDNNIYFFQSSSSSSL